MKCIFCDFDGNVSELREHSATCGNHPAVMAANVSIAAAIRHASRLIAAAIMMANGDYTSDGLLHNVDWLEDVMRMGE